MLTLHEELDMNCEEIKAIGRERYGRTRFLVAMSKETGIPYPTLWRYANDPRKIIKPLAASAIYALKGLPKQEKKVDRLIK